MSLTAGSQLGTKQFERGLERTNSELAISLETFLRCAIATPPLVAARLSSEALWDARIELRKRTSSFALTADCTNATAC